MDKRQIIKMIFSIVLPPVMVIVLFAVAIWVIIIPATEDALMQKKQDIIQAIVISATSIMEKHAQMEKDGLVSKEESQQAALNEMRALRYGAGNKDYLWITDLKPSMVMHPYFPELEGSYLDEYADSEGKLFFVEAVEIAKSTGEGYINYRWPRHDNMEETVPKLSYIRLFEPWGWVVGSGIYLDDVQAEINAVTLRLLVISGWIGIIVMLLLIFVSYRGWKSEKGRCLAERELIRSRERYQALAHASDEMIFLTINGIIAGANKKACDTLGMNEDEIISHRFTDFFTDSAVLDMLASAETGGNITALETVIHGKSGPERILLSAEYAIVHDSPATLYTGYSFQLADEPDNGLIIKESLRKCGFGMLVLDNVASGKIKTADRIATSLFTKNSSKSVVRKSLRDLLHEGDASRLFIQLQKEKKVTNMLVRYPVWMTGTGYLQVWAAVIEDTKVAEGQVIVLIQDITNAHTAGKASDDLLAELLSPERKLFTGPQTFDTLPDGSMQEQFLRSKVILRQSVKMGLDPDKVTSMSGRFINKMFDYAVQRAILSLGPPPCRYALLALGSIGRSEPTLYADQDTAIIFESGTNDAENAKYFQQFGSIVTSICADAGIPQCHAGNTAGNPDWCLSDGEWKQKFLSWINTNQPEDLLLVNIFFDFRTLAGDESFAVNLRQVVFKKIEQRPVFLFNLAQDTLGFRSPADMLGRIRPDSRKENYVDLKIAMLHFVNFARIYALRNSIDETNTIRRLQALLEGCHLPSDLCQETIEAWKFLMGLRLRFQVSAMDMNFSPKNLLLLEDLSTWENAMLKRALMQVSSLQKMLSSDIVNRC